jgi:DNA-directed RNA polymerase specialized sigma24 family protein
MVLRVCRRVLRHLQDAEDAFQATFLVLAAVHRPSTAAHRWRTGCSVAHRLALRARADAARRLPARSSKPVATTQESDDRVLWAGADGP